MSEKYRCLVFFGENIFLSERVRINGWAKGRILLIEDKRICVQGAGWMKINTIWCIERLVHSPCLPLAVKGEQS